MWSYLEKNQMKLKEKMRKIRFMKKNYLPKMTFLSYTSDGGPERVKCQNSIFCKKWMNWTV
jgi:hypothetical protein